MAENPDRDNAGESGPAVTAHARGGAGRLGVDHGTTKTELVIMGMRDNSCRERILDALMAVDGVTDASVSLLRARAVVRHNPSCDRARLVWGVVHAGYGAALATPSNGAA